MDKNVERALSTEAVLRRKGVHWDVVDERVIQPFAQSEQNSLRAVSAFQAALESGMHNGLVKSDDIQMSECAVATDVADEQEQCNIAAAKDVVIKFDTAASRCMSGVPGRIVSVDADDDRRIIIRGFNGSTSTVDKVGRNVDQKTEYFVSKMPDNLALLCANDYARDGAVVLLGDRGVVLRLSESEKEQLEAFIEQFAPVYKLKVVNRTYEVDNATPLIEQEELAHTSSSTTYFNTKVNCSNTEERILAYLLSGLTVPNMIQTVKNGSIGGLHPDITVRALYSFSHKWGESPDAVQLGHPSKLGNKKGYMSVSEQSTQCGAYVEMDYFEPEFNEISTVGSSPLHDDNGLKKKMSRKIMSHGGAIAGCVTYDSATGYVNGRLVQSVAKPLALVKESVERYALSGHLIKEFAADSGVVSQSQYRVLTTEVETYLLSQGIKFHRAEPHNHSNGSPGVERTIRSIKELIRTAVHYILRNPNFEFTGFRQVDILKLWGELFYWSLTIINMRPSKSDDKITRHEAFHKTRPNIQDIRLLPIFSIVMIYREKLSNQNVFESNHDYYQYGLYVGPDLRVTGGIRAAIMSSGALQVIVTSKYKGVSDGGGLSVHPMIQNGADAIMQIGNEHQFPSLRISCSDNVVRVEKPQPERVEQVGQSPARAVTAAEQPENNESDNECPALIEKSECPTKSNLSVVGHSMIEPRKQRMVSPLLSSLKPVVEVVEQRVPVTVNTTTRTETRAVRSVSPPAAKPVRDQSSSPNTGVKSRGAGQKKSVYDPASRPSRAERMKAKHEEGFFADWSECESGDYYFSFSENSFYVDNSHSDQQYRPQVEVTEGYKAVTVNVPRDFPKALVHPVWGEPSRTEWSTIVDAKAMVKVSIEFAREQIKAGADVVYLFPIYEEKFKEGKTVLKVRLVGDGRTQHHATDTYSPTPSREELLVLLHIVGKLDWDYYLVDEKRAFLNSKRRGKDTVLARVKGDPNYWSVSGALYGLKTSPKDYDVESANRLLSLGFTRLHMQSCIFVKQATSTTKLTIVFKYVDDYFVTGPEQANTLKEINKFRELVSTTEPELNAPKVLGAEISRDRKRRLIFVKMEGKIDELNERFQISTWKRKNMPMPCQGYIVQTEDFELPQNEQVAAFLDDKQREEYMQIVGSLIWLCGIRLDIVFAVMYLSWSTKQPRVHHAKMAYHLLSYLYYSKDMPLVLGGTDDLRITSYTDASLGTGPKGRSILGHATKLGVNAGAINAKSTASTIVHLSSFEAELDGVTTAFKTVSRLINMLTELGFVGLTSIPMVYSDNEAMVNFVKGQGVAKGVRHMQLRMWYTREVYQEGRLLLAWMSGKQILADHLTKLATAVDHRIFAENIMGLKLLQTEA